MTHLHYRQLPIVRAGILFFSIGLLAALAGCQRQSAQPDEGEASRLATERDHFHEHEHFVPEHRPADFGEAVTQISARFAGLQHEQNAGHHDHALQELGELIDIVRWLPEIAADSDLQESSWNEVHGISLRLDAILSTYVGPGAKFKNPAKISTDDIASIHQGLARLDQIVDQGDWLDVEMAPHDQFVQYRSFMQTRSQRRGIRLPAQIAAEDPATDASQARSSVPSIETTEAVP